MKARLRRWYCMASAWPSPFGDYVFAASRAAAAKLFQQRHHVTPYLVRAA